MTKQDGKLIAQNNELRILKMLHKFGFLRTRDIAALVWMQAKAATSGVEFELQSVYISASALRMAQITLLRLKTNKLVYSHLAPDSSLIYGLTEAGARRLQGHDIPASSASDWLRKFSTAQYHHRRIANEIAICALIQGYRVATEREIAAGLWIGGMEGIYGKKPDVLVRSSKIAWWIEVERSHKNKRDYDKLIVWLNTVWPGGTGHATIGNHALQQVIFVSNTAFMNRLKADLKSHSWTDHSINLRIRGISSLYVSEAKFLMKEPRPRAEGAGLLEIL